MMSGCTGVFAYSCRVLHLLHRVIGLGKFAGCLIKAATHVTPIALALNLLKRLGDRDG